MSCNGCRVLRKGCSDNCILRQSLQGIQSPQAQGHATVFVAKFFGRAGLVSFLSAVPDSQRPALFQSLLFEACGRTVNPVNGAIGLMWTRNWHVCQSAVETVLRGGVVKPMPELFGGGGLGNDDASEASNKGDNLYKLQDLNCPPQKNIIRTSSKRKGFDVVGVAKLQPEDLALGLMNGRNNNSVIRRGLDQIQKRRAGTPSDESETTTLESCNECPPINLQRHDGETKLLKLFL